MKSIQSNERNHWPTKWESQDLGSKGSIEVTGSSGLFGGLIGFLFLGSRLKK